MTTITERRREHVELTRPEEISPRESAAPRTAPSQARSDTREKEAIERLPVSSDYGAFLATLPKTSRSAGPVSAGRSPSSTDAARTALVSPVLRNARDAGVQQKLDTFRARFAGPYDVGGTSVKADPLFRMNTPNAANAKKMEAHASELTQICAKAGVSAAAAGAARVGRCTPEQLVAVTQALIDAGKLPPPDAAHKDLAQQIRGMQWEWGIGIDCAGYTQQAAAEVHGAGGAVFKGNLMGDVFTGMMNDKRFESVQIASIRPGDVIHLDSPQAGQVGHNVICYAHRTLDDAARAAIIRTDTTGAAGKQFLSGPGPFHAFEVDSSWGAGDGLMVGGFRRDTWIYDEGTFTWASYPTGDRKQPLVPEPMTGPQNELFGGAFRPRGTR